MKMDVSKNTKRNITVGFINKIVMLLMPFFTKSIINKVLGSQFLGLNSLFTSIIQVLSLTELGFSSVLVFNMYKPIATNNQEKINALVKLYKKVYRFIGLLILVFGLLLAPFLPRLINGEIPSNINIYYLYLIQLLNVAISYFLFAHRQALLVAYQREDINSIINTIIQVFLNLMQIMILLRTSDYYLYTLCLPLFTIAKNIFYYLATKKLFPNAKEEGVVDRETLRSIKKLVIGAFIEKVCMVTRNSLDSICISYFLGLTMTAIYSNYYTVYAGLLAFLGIIVTSLTAGIGNHVAIKSIEENFSELRKLDFLYMGISGVCTICLLCTYQTFMEFWMGDKMLLPMSSVILICVYFYLLNMGNIRSLYKLARGLWWKMRYRAIVESLLNIVLNIILGAKFGINGIIVATIISLFLCNFIWGSHIFFFDYFGKRKMIQYFLYHLKYLVQFVLIAIITCLLVNKIFISEGLLFTFLIKAVLSFLISGLLFIVINCRTTTFKNSYKMILKRTK